MIDPIYSDTTEQPLIRQLQIPNYPVTPPPELVKQWQYEANHNEAMFPQVATQAARWGADMELEACCEWLEKASWIDSEVSEELRMLRRPKPPSLKAQALKVLESAPGPDYPSVMTVLDADQHALIRRALEALDD